MMILRGAALAAWMMATTVTAWAQQPPSPGAQAAMRAVIGQQIEAFRHDDEIGAYALASPHIQQMFGSPDNFMAMVKRGYMPVYRPQSVTFGAAGSEDGAPTQEVDLIGPDGRSAHAHYTLQQQPDGSWRIDGCALTLGAYLGT
jgi:hypothetical protein